jgi:hypothetical protein
MGARMIPRHLLQHDDFEWFLDHGQRWFRVVPLGLDDEGRPLVLRVVPINGSEPTMMAARCRHFPGEWEDSDRYASARLVALNMSGSVRHRGGAR